MARLARPTKALSDDDDEFPDINTLVRKKTAQAEANRKSSATPAAAKKTPKNEEPVNPATTVRRRRLGPLSDNLLLRAWTPDSAGECRGKETIKPRRPRVELRTRRPSPPVIVPSSPGEQEEDYVSAKEEVTIIEEVSILDDTFHSCESGDSDEDRERGSDEDTEYKGTEDDDDDFIVDSPPRRSRSKSRLQMKDRKLLGADAKPTRRKNGSAEAGEEGLSHKTPGRRRLVSKAKLLEEEGQKARATDKRLADSLSRLKLDESDEKSPGESLKSSTREATPPSTPPKSRPGLISPRKLPRIPTTPHHPTSDAFWSQEFVDDWNDEHSPRKQLFPDAVAARQRSPEKKHQPKMPSDREAKRAFAKAKHQLAETFLRDLDAQITNNQLSEMAASTGGIKLIWTNKLNTTAGRANWKRETVRTHVPAALTTNPNNNNNPSEPTITIKHKHHASIELAEKVIDSEPRLLNVLAHEFCHLANFMVSGITTNPHGREFKAWAAKVTRAFAHKGIQVTTKHSYDIDFKYVWACAECGAEYKRHSKSIDPERHRCGGCRGELRQVKPVPRGAGKEGDGGKNGGGGNSGKDGGGGKKVSEYQVFMKEQMRLVKEERPGTPQTEVMKIVAARWALKREGKGVVGAEGKATEGDV